METDASDFAVAAILSQILSDRWHPVAFWSRKMIPAERNYETHDQELLAIVDAFKQWRHYLEGSRYPIEVLTDHNNLRGFMNVKALNGRQARWAVRLSSFDFTISHRPGKQNPADAPSRRPDYAGVNESMHKLLPTLQHKLAVIGGVIATCPHQDKPWWVELERKTNTVVGAMTLRPRNPQSEPELSEGAGETPSQPSRSVALELNPAAGTAGCKQLVPRVLAKEVASHETAYDSESEPLIELTYKLQQVDTLAQRQLSDIQARAKRRVNAGKKESPWAVDPAGILRHEGRVYIPAEETLRAEILRKHHDDPLAGHYGTERTRELLTRKYYWPGVAKYIEDYIRTCDICQRTKSQRHRPYGEMQALPQPKRPWEEITMDFITGLPPSLRRGNVYDTILVVVDRYTKMACYIATTKDIDAPGLADLIFERIISQYGIPNGIVSDRGSVFTSAFWSEICFYTKVKRRLSTAFHPQTDGQTERQNQTLEHYLRVYATEEQDNWARLLPFAEFTYNNSVQATTKCSPFYALYGYNPEIDINIGDDIREGEIPAAKERVAQIHNAREALEKSYANAVESQTKYYNKVHTPKKYRKGQLVLLNAKNLKQKRPSKKLSHKFIGPFRISNVIGEQAYELELPADYRIHPVFHVSLLEAYNRRDNDSEMPEYPLPELIDNVPEYEVEEILERQRIKGKLCYRVKWIGYPEEFNEWVPHEHLKASELQREYDDKHPVRRRGRPSKAKA